MFDEFEEEHYLCTRFIMFIRSYKLIPEKIFTKDKQIPANSLYFDRNERIKHYQYILFQKEQRSKQERERKEREMKENNINVDSQSSSSSSEEAKIIEDDVIIKEDSDESSSEEENENEQDTVVQTQVKNNEQNGSSKAKNEDFDEEQALAEIYSDDPI